MDKIRKNFALITQTLHIESIFLSYFLSQGIFEAHNIQHILQDTSTSVMTLLVKLYRCGPKGFNCFFEALELTEQYDLLNILKE